MCLILRAGKSISGMKKEQRERVCNVMCTVGALDVGLDEDS